jgi:hypothetical protein
MPFCSSGSVARSAIRCGTVRHHSLVNRKRQQPSAQPIADWIAVDSEVRVDGNNDQAVRDLKARNAKLVRDPDVLWRMDVTCARDGTASVTLLRSTEPAVREAKKKPRTAKP